MKGVRRFLIPCFAAAVIGGCLEAQPVVLSVLNGASFTGAMSPGSVISIFGANFAADNHSAPTGAPQVSLGGVSVTVDRQPALLVSVGPREIQAVIPFEVGQLRPTHFSIDVPLVVTTPAGSASYTIHLTRDAPAVFTQGGAALVFDASFTQVPAVYPQQPLIFYATGLGPVDASGRVVDTTDVYLGERKAQLLYAGAAPGMPGVYQVNIIAPQRLATDRLFIRSGGWQSNIVYMATAEILFNQFRLKRPLHTHSAGIPAGNNASNVRGTIDGLYPSSDPAFPQVACTGTLSLVESCGSESLSVTLYAGTFTVSFDINPSAVPFDVAAVGDAGGTVISIDPAARTWLASVTTPIEMVRHGDFSTTVVPLWDYTDCSNDGICRPFPGPSVIPADRLSPFWIRATRQLPPATTTDPGNPDGIYQSSGTISGSHFVVDAQNNSTVANFGGFLQTVLSPFASATAAFRLYVDGRLIATKNVRYVPAQRCFFTGAVCWSPPQELSKLIP